jgi:hypothetical protein
VFTPGSVPPTAVIAPSTLRGTAPLTVSYSAAGSCTTVLRVTDNAGLSASTSITVTVDAPVVAMRVADIAMGLTVRNGRGTATAAVKVVDARGLPVAGASVTGQWSGLTSGTSTLTTDATGLARFTSASTRSGGTFRFAVTNVSRTGCAHAPLTNTETSDSIVR